MPSDGGAGKGRAGWTGVAQRRLRRIIISQLRILGIVGFPIPTYDAQIVHLAEAEGISLGLRLASSRYLSGYERGNSGKKFTFTYNLSMNPSEIEMFLEIQSRLTILARGERVSPRPPKGLRPPLPASRRQAVPQGTAGRRFCHHRPRS